MNFRINWYILNTLIFLYSKLLFFKKESLVQYNNIYNEGIGIKISYNLDELKIVFIKDYRLSYVINKLTFIEDNCRLISNIFLKKIFK